MKVWVYLAMCLYSLSIWADEANHFENGGPVLGRTSDMKNIIQLSPKSDRVEGVFFGGASHLMVSYL